MSELPERTTEQELIYHELLAAKKAHDKREVIRNHAPELLTQLKGAEVALRAIVESGLLPNSNAILQPLTEQIAETIAKAEGRS